MRHCLSAVLVRVAGFERHGILAAFAIDQMNAFTVFQARHAGILGDCPWHFNREDPPAGAFLDSVLSGPYDPLRLCAGAFDV